MGWAETRQRARRTVHATFSLPAVYTPPGIGAVPVNCMARMHNEAKLFGDLDREGYAQMIEDVNQVIFDALEVEPVKFGVVTFYQDTARTVVIGTFEINNILPKTTDEFRRVEVTHV